jgi:hypothetical protein
MMGKKLKSNKKEQVITLTRHMGHSNPAITMPDFEQPKVVKTKQDEPITLSLSMDYSNVALTIAFVEQLQVLKTE